MLKHHDPMGEVSVETINTRAPEQRHPRSAYTKEYVRAMFNAIAFRYDFLNHLLSSGLDIAWRKRLISFLAPHKPAYILDVATGTADVALEASRLRPLSIVGLDLSEEMLSLGRSKIRKQKLDHLITLKYGEAEQIQYPDQTFDAVTVAFGVRNFENLHQGLSEIFRVLRPNGVALILEFSKPRAFLIAMLYRWYSQRVLPFIGRMISRHREAYEYLPATVYEFPDGDDFLHILRKPGFRSVSQHPLSFGIATIYQAQK